MLLRRHRVKLQPWTDSIGILIHFPNFSFSQISMLLEDKELKKSIPLQLNRGRGPTSAKRNQKINSKNHEIFQKFQSHYPRLWIQDHTSEQNFGTPLSSKQSHLFPFTLTFWRGPFSETPVLKVLLPDKWTLRGCLYENGNKLSHPYWPGNQKLFLLHGIFIGDASSIWKKCDQCILK